MSVHSTNNPTKTVLVRLALGTAASVAVVVAAAAPASAINQDQADGAGGMFRGPSPAPYAVSAESSGAVDVTSAALGALGGIALGGAGLAVTLGVQRRRDHADPQHA
jgi:hypothetical protein